jgi:ADP-ribosylglycohydrolase
VPDLALPLRLSGAIWGHIVGDAVGVPFEFRDATAIGEVEFGATGTHRQPPGTWSDDGALMLALLDSLVNVGFDPEDQGQRALAWRRDGAYAPGGLVFDIGGTTSAALGAIEAGTPALDAGPSGERSQSNGSLMRILPIALWGSDHEGRSELARLAATASRVTHNHPTCRAACAVYTLIVDDILRDANRHEILPSALAAARATFKADAEMLAAIEALDHWPDAHQPAGRGGALDAFWSAWTAFSAADSYRDAIVRAIRFGNDTDTTAAIAGGLAGAFWGLDAIPADWLAGMREPQLVAPLIDALLVRHRWKTSTSHPLRVDWVDLAQVPGLHDAAGALGMTFLVGKQGTGWHGDWWRDLDADARRLRDVHGADVYVQLIEDHELVTTRTERLAEVIAANGIELVRRPVKDMSVPIDRPAYRAFLDDLRGRVGAGQRIVIACRGGLGRTGTAVACLLVDAGMSSEDAIALTRVTRRETIERGVQVSFVVGWDGYRSGAAFRSPIQRATPSTAGSSARIDRFDGEDPKLVRLEADAVDDEHGPAPVDDEGRLASPAAG